MIKRVFSRETYNGYHLVSFKGEGEDGPVGFFKKTEEKDEFGFVADVEDIPKCPSPGYYVGAPWDPWLYVPSGCQKCPWVYRTPNNESDCLLKTKKGINPRALVNGTN